MVLFHYHKCSLERYPHLLLKRKIHGKTSYRQKHSVNLSLLRWLQYATYSPIAYSCPLTSAGFQETESLISQK